MKTSTKVLIAIFFIAITMLFSGKELSKLYHTTFNTSSENYNISPKVIEELKNNHKAAEEEVIKAKRELQDMIAQRDALLKNPEIIASQLYVKKVREQLVSDDEVGLYKCKSIHMVKSKDGGIDTYARGIALVRQDLKTFNVDFGDKTVYSGVLKTVEYGGLYQARNVVNDEIFVRVYGDSDIGDDWYYVWETHNERTMMVECNKL